MPSNVIQFPAAGSRIGGEQWLGEVEGLPSSSVRLRLRCAELINSLLVIQRAAPWMTEREAKSYLDVTAHPSRKVHETSARAQTFIDYYDNNGGDDCA